ncbi:MAG: aldehyde dehydrogenase family protein [Woeseia sp.]|nr:aldehyde dehydrogenase family protein [Woeseia sp.]MBT8098075.1 aldehyde dehydrogenase family protein [Woeseia sp.]
MATSTVSKKGSEAAPALTDFYINGAWVAPAKAKTFDVINPANEQPVAKISLGSAADVDQAVAAARAAFASYSQTTKDERIALLERILDVYKRRYEEMAEAITTEMGAPKKFSYHAQAECGSGHLAQAIEALKTYEFEERMGNSIVRKEPVGVCAFITPWNWPINQIACKVAPALAMGCTMVLKPSEVAPLSAHLFAEILDEAGVPPGVFNLIDGDGITVGAALAAHPDVDMVSFTGSTRAGIEVAKAAADTVKRVAQELGGKSPNIILEDADFERAVKSGVRSCFSNSGQSCNAPTRMLVPRAKLAEAQAIAKAVAEKTVVGDPLAEGTHLGPVVSELQYTRIQKLINKAIEEGTELVSGGPGKPDGLQTGYYVKPTVFGNVNNDMTIAREEVFGPVLAILPYDDEADAIRIANDTEYGLSGYVQSGDKVHARRVAEQLRTGMVHINGANGDYAAPFGGYKKSGNGREWGVYGFEDFVEVKALMGLD